MLRQFCILPTIIPWLLFSAFVHVATQETPEIKSYPELASSRWSFGLNFNNSFDGVSISATRQNGAGYDNYNGFCQPRWARCDWLSFNGDGVFGFGGYKTADCSDTPIFEIRETTSFYSVPENWESYRILPPVGYAILVWWFAKLGRMGYCKTSESDETKTSKTSSV